MAGNESAGSWQGLIQRADTLTGQGHLTDALELLRGQVNGALPAGLVDTTEGEVLCYARMGTLAWQLGRHDEALRHTWRAYDLCRGLGDGDGCMTYLERLWALTEERETAEDSRTVAETAARDTRQFDQTRLLPRWLARYGQVLLRLDDVPAAQEFAHVTVRYADELLDVEPDEFSRVLNTAAHLLRRTGDRDTARALYERAIECREAAGMVDTTLGVLYGNLGHLLLEEHSPDAERALAEGLALLSCSPEAEPDRLAEVRNNLAVHYYRAGDHDRAMLIYQQLVDGGAASATALRNFDRLRHHNPQPAAPTAQLPGPTTQLPAIEGPDNPSDNPIDRFEDLILRAGVERQLGDHERAGELLQEAEWLAEHEAGPASWQAAVVRAELTTSDHPDAERLFGDALAAARQDPDCPPRIAQQLRNDLGLWYFWQGRPQDAVRVLEHAAVNVDPRSVDHHGLSMLTNLALAYHHTRQLHRAEQLYRLVLRRRRELLPDSHPLLAQSLFNLGMLYLGTGRADEGLALLREQFELEDRWLDETFAVSGDEQRVAHARRLLEYLDTLVSEVLPVVHRDSAGPASELLLDAVLRRKALVVDAATGPVRPRDPLATVDDGTRRTIAELADVRHQLHRLAVEDVAPNPRGTTGLAQQQRRLNDELAELVPEYGFRRWLRGTRWPAVAQALPESTALVEFYRMRVGDQAGYLSVVLAPGTAPQTFVHGPAENLDRGVDAWRQLMLREGGAPAEPEMRIGQELHRVLIGRIAGSLPRVARLLIAPDGALHRLPFAALPDAEGGRLLDRYEIGLVGSGRDLLRPRQPSRDRPLVVADPDYDMGHPPAPGSPVHMWFDRLPDTWDEGSWIAEHMGANLLAGPKALEARLKAAGGPRVLHLATHGFAVETPPRHGGQAPAEPPPAGPPDPMRCTGLALAGANRWLAGHRLPPDAEDGLLTPVDAGELDLAGTELVVLSTRATARETGSKLSALRRAFEAAGARSVVTAVWTVPGEPTTLLMREFYRGLVRGLPRTGALRNAQQAVRRRFPEPAVWAPFTCYGDPAPIRGGS